MRILYVITRSDAIGGAHVHVRDLCLALSRQGHDVAVAVGGDGPFIQELRSREIECHILPSLVREIRPAKDLRCLHELRRVIRAFCPDVVSTHSSKAGWLGRIAARSLGVPVIFTAHGWAFTEGVSKAAGAAYRFAERLVAPLAHRIITVSDYDRELALQAGLAEPHQIISIHNGVPDVQVRPPDRRTQEVKLIMVARFEEQKDHATLISALAGLRNLRWTLQFVGDGPLKSRTEELASSHNVRDRIEFVGSRSDVAALLASADVFLLISKWEGFPRSILEAMRAGLPVVASDVGGVRESVEPLVSGFLIPRYGVAPLAEALRALIGSADLRRSLGRNGRMRFERCFTFDRMLAKTLAQYESVVGSRATSLESAGA
jgi:glycosyltransferase involved in cell wall biosynthesis